MFRYIFKRLLYAVPTLLLVSFIAFYLNDLAPIDHVETILNIQGYDSSSDGYVEVYETTYEELRLGDPIFYFTVHRSDRAWRSTFKGDREDRDFADTWISKGYGERTVTALLASIKRMDARDQGIVLGAQSESDLLARIASIGPDAMGSYGSSFENVFSKMTDKAGWHYPVLKWHGASNQYHYWIGGILAGDFGNSLQDMRPVWDKIAPALVWTMTLFIVSILIAVFLSLLIGVYAGVYPGSRFDRWSGGLLFAGYSVPKFWSATMLIIFFTTAEYGGWTNIFPGVGVWDGAGGSVVATIIASWRQFLLPVMIIVLPDVAYLSRLIRASVVEEYQKDYIISARSKGVNRRDIIMKHLLPNSLVSTITILTSSIPSAIASALVIEVIFNIPGVGRLLYSSILASDWNVVFPIVLMVSVVSIIVFLLGDILIAFLNPKLELR